MNPCSGSAVYGAWIVLRIAALSVGVIVLLPFKGTPTWTKLQWAFYRVQSELIIWGESKKRKQRERDMQILRKLP